MSYFNYLQPMSSWGDSAAPLNLAGSLYPPVAQPNMVLPGSPEVPGYNSLGLPAPTDAPLGLMGQFSQWAKSNGLLDSIDTNTGMRAQGLASPMLSALGGIGNGYMALKQYGMAKDALATSKAQFNKQYAAQRQLTNANLEGRQREMAAAKYGSSTGAAANNDVATYMAKYGVK